MPSAVAQNLELQEGEQNAVYAALVTAPCGVSGAHCPQPPCDFQCHIPLTPQSHSLTASNISDPRALAIVLEQAEARLAKDAHPDPYRRELGFFKSLAIVFSI